MKLSLLMIKYNELPDGIKNTAKYYPEGRDILICCLVKNANTTQAKVIEFLKENKIEIYNLKTYHYRNNLP